MLRNLLRKHLVLTEQAQTAAYLQKHAIRLLDTDKATEAIHMIGNFIETPGFSISVFNLMQHRRADAVSRSQCRAKGNALVVCSFVGGAYPIVVDDDDGLPAFVVLSEQFDRKMRKMKGQPQHVSAPEPRFPNFAGLAEHPIPGFESLRNHRCLARARAFHGLICG